MSRRGLIDTGPLVAFIDRRDGFHGWAVDALSHFDAPLRTCDAVIAEAWHLLRHAESGREALIGLLDSKNVVVTFSLAAETPGITKLMSKYADQPMAVADACLVRMAQLDSAATIITLDGDFKVYRNGRKTLKLIAPFAHS